jgi:hypothetical protein
VKCKQHHSTQDCTKLPSEPPTYVNCGGAHPANYSGCPDYQKLLATRTRKPLLSNSKPTQSPSQRIQFPTLNKPRHAQRQERTWAQVAAATTTTTEEQTLPTILKSLKTLFSSLNLQLLCTSLHSLASNLTNATNPLDKIMFIVDTFVSCFSSP